MSTETNTTIPNYQDAYDKAQRCIKLAMDAVKHLSGFENYFQSGAYKNALLMNKVNSGGEPYINKESLINANQKLQNDFQDKDTIKIEPIDSRISQSINE